MGKVIYLFLFTSFVLVMEFYKSFIINNLELHPFSQVGKTVIVTGGTDGIGKEMAKILVSWGANVILPVRNLEKGEAVKQEILSYIEGTTGNGTVSIVGEVDFESFASVRNFVDGLKGVKVDLLVNNAGMKNNEVKATKDQIEQVFQVNHLSPFLLTRLLLPYLSFGSRVVFVSSNMNYLGTSDLVGPKYWQDRGMSNVTARGGIRYSDTKLMNVMCAMSFHERFGKERGISFTSLHPGYTWSNFDSNMPTMAKRILVPLRKHLSRTTFQGAITPLTVATHPKLASVEAAGGKFFSDYCINTLCTSPCLWCDKENPPGVVPSRDALVKSTRDWLWKISSELTGLDESITN